MRTNIDIDDELMQQAMSATGTTTKKAAVEAALSLAVQLKRQAEAIESLRGLVVWRGPDDDWFASDEEILEKRRREDVALEPVQHRQDYKARVEHGELQSVGESGGI